MDRKTRRWIKFSIILAIIFLWSSFLLFVNPVKIVDFFGVHNVYVFIFLLSAIAGGSSFTAPSMYALLVTFIIGGTPLIPVAILAGLGSTIGDCAYMYLGKRSHKVLSSKIQRNLNKIISKLESKPKIILPFFIFLYAAFAPIPNDFMTISLGLAGYKIRNAIIPIIIGNIIYFFILLSVGTIAYATLL